MMTKQHKVVSMPRTAQSWVAAGFTEIVPVTPPDCKLSPKSELKPENRGKSPGRRGHDGYWGGYNWRVGNATMELAQMWDRWGANLGLRASLYPGLDIDVTCPHLSDIIATVAVWSLGAAPTRIGRAPKRLMPYRLAAGQAPMQRRRLTFRDSKGKQHLIEMLGHGQQYVVEGRHPATRAPYTWDQHPTDPECKLVGISKDDVDTFFAAVAQELIKAGCTDLSELGGADVADRSGIDQDMLKAPSLDLLREVMASFPNNDETAPDYADYIKVGHAIRAAGADWPGEAQELWLDWSSQHPDNTDEQALAKWETFNGPFSTGFQFLATQATQYGGFNGARYAFEPIYEEEAEGTDDDPYDVPVEGAGQRENRFKPMSMDALSNLPRNTYIIKEVIVKTSLASIYGASASFKTFAALDWGLSLAYGLDWKDHATEKGAVIYVAAEGAHGISGRVSAWRRTHGLEDVDAPFFVVPTAVNMVDNTQEVDELIEAIRNTHPDVQLVILDTLARNFGSGDENSNQAMNTYVSNCDRIRETLHCSVLSVHHTGKDASKGARGGSAWFAALDTEIKCERIPGTMLASLTVTKQKDGRDQYLLCHVKAESVTLGKDDDGNDVVSLVLAKVTPKEVADVKTSERDLTKPQSIAMAALVELMGENGGFTLRNGIPSVSFLDFHNKCSALGISASSSSDEAIAKAVRRARRDLQNLKLIDVDEAERFIWLQAVGDEKIGGTPAEVFGNLQD